MLRHVVGIDIAITSLVGKVKLSQNREVRDRLIDRRHEELARQQEQARAAMDAIRHAGCTFNPFSGL